MPLQSGEAVRRALAGVRAVAASIVQMFCALALTVLDSSILPEIVGRILEHDVHA